MDSVQIVQVDERDNHWENHHARFRVYLHGSGAASTSVPDPYNDGTETR